MQNNFGPNYRTSAAQRAARYISRNPAGLAAAAGGGSDATHRSALAQHVPVAHRVTAAAAAGEGEQETIVANAAHSTHRNIEPSLQDIVGPDQLMDLDNSLLESVVDNMGMSVDVRQRARERVAVTEFSNATDYLTVDEYRCDRTYNVGSNPLRSNDQIRASFPHRRASDLTSFFPQYEEGLVNRDQLNYLQRSAPGRVGFSQQYRQPNRNSDTLRANEQVGASLPYGMRNDNQLVLPQHEAGFGGGSEPYRYHRSVPDKAGYSEQYREPDRNLQHSRFELNKTDRMVVMELVKNVKTANGSNEFELLNFLKDLRPIFEVCPQKTAEIVKLLLPKVSGQLFKLWVQAVSSAAGWDALHNAILERFLPPLRRREIEAIELERPQRPDETFSDYVENVISTAFALRTTRQEREVIESILSRCLPGTKMHFAFGSEPRNLSELRSLANRVTSSVNAESRYFGQGMQSFGAQSSQNFPGGQSRFQKAQGSRTYTNTRQVDDRKGERKPINCFKCGGVGHVQKHCRASLN